MVSIRHRPRELALALILLAGCAGAPPDEVSAGVRENGVLALTRADNNRTAELRVGERLEVRLPENPATGFSWAVDENDRRLLALEDTAYTPPDEAGFIGARGQRTFRFTARQPGDVALKLKYWRVWEGDGSVTERFAVTLKIVQ
jgi:inhibitor of cysteine peptidase